MLGFGAIAKKIFGTTNDRILRSYQKTVDAINAMEPEIEKLSDDEIKAQTEKFRERLQSGKSLDDILVEAFATVREAAKRTLQQRHFDVQLIGGIVLHRGDISEMKTGEGKTLVATLAVYLNAIENKGVHVVTVNDYLAKRDSEWMGQVYNFLGLTVGTIVHGLNDDERRAAYAADVTYGTNNEYGFDYLRDNMKSTREQMVQRPFNFSIVDEVDSILIDEARTPLIISGPTQDKSDLYITIDRLVRQLGEEDYEKDEKQRSITLTEVGTERIENTLKEAKLLKTDNLYDYENSELVHHVDQALKAQKMFECDKDYIVKDNRVIIIDEFTGRMMEGRRYSGGLHQALEAKEGADIQAENQTLASITFQNYFRLYPKLSGMTGTAATEAQEFADIYGLNVVEIPTNVAVGRVDEHDEFYRTAKEKYEALVEEIGICQKNDQPMLVGTVSIEKSEHLSDFLKKRKIKHNVLNARYHEQEASIISQAGRAGAVTIATNMAGRGTDIQLGGNFDMRVEEETKDIEDEAERQKISDRIKADIAENKEKVIAAGGLYVIATERHESRRIDNQLRGRSGRQGDPGRSKFYLSLEDDLMRVFGPERMDSMLVKLGLEEGEAIIHPWINKAIEKAQQKVEARNYEMRKNVLKYDDVMNDQRKAIYEQRIDIMSATEVSETIIDMREETIEEIVATHIPPKSYADKWNIEGLGVDVRRIFGLDIPVEDWAKEEGVDEEVFIARIKDHAARKMAEKAARYGPDFWRHVEKSLLLQVIDQTWIDHLSTLDHLRQTVNLRAYAQRDPLNEYKMEAFAMFEKLLIKVREEISQLLSHIEFSTEQNPDMLVPQEKEMHPRHIDATTGENDARPAAELNPDDPASWGKVPRNAPCPCGSGKKYKHCHGRL